MEALASRAKLSRYRSTIYTFKNILSSYSFRPFCNKPVEEEDPELPEWLREPGTPQNNKNDLFVLPGTEEQVQIKPSKPLTDNAIQTTETPLKRISWVLNKKHPTIKECQYALDDLPNINNSDLTEELVLQLLKSFENHWVSAYGFYRWTYNKRRLCVHSSMVFDNMVDILCKGKQFNAMWELVNEMKDTKGMVSANTFVKIIRRYAGLKRPEDSLMAFRIMEEDFGITVNTDTLNAVLDSLCKENQTGTAWDCFMEYRERVPPNAISYNIMLHGWCRMRKYDWVVKIMDMMRSQGFVPDVFSYTSVIESHCSRLDFDKAFKVLDEMSDHGVTPSVVTYTILMDALGKAKETQEAYKVYERMIANGCVPDTCFYNSLIFMLGDAGRIKAAYDLFHEMEKHGCKPNVGSYNALLESVCKLVQEDMAYDLFKQMLKKDIKPNHKTYVYLFKLCCKLNRTKIIKYLLDDMVKKECSPDLTIYSVLVTGFIRMAKPLKACYFFEEALGKGIIPPHRLFLALHEALSEAKEFQKQTEIQDRIRQMKRSHHIKEAQRELRKTVMDFDKTKRRRRQKFRFVLAKKGPKKQE